jgi:2-keto-3-deoxy-L-rhamnonate aldolase RhmA
MKTPFNQRLRQGTPLVGTLLTTASREIAEVVQIAGFDWVFIDMEHGAIEPSHVLGLLQTLAAGPSALVRIPENHAGWYKKALDGGADGVIVPLVRTAADARFAVASAKYPPLGARSVGIGRAHGYGPGFKTYVERANADVSLVLQIEHIEAVENLEDILAVPGVDAAFIGPFDLSSSMGLLGEVRHPDVRRAIDEVKRACRARDVPFGIFTTTAAAVAEETAAGCAFVAVGTDLAFLGAALADTLRAIRAPGRAG